MSADHSSSLVYKLYHFYACFVASTANISMLANTSILANATEMCSPIRELVPEHDVRRTLRRVNGRKGACPEGNPSRVLKTSTEPLSLVLTTIFNLTLSIVPSCVKRSTITPVSKSSTPAELKDYHPVALTSLVMKGSERLIKDFICSSVHSMLDPLQFAY